MTTTSESQRASIDPATELDAALEQLRGVKITPGLAPYAESLDTFRADLDKIAADAKEGRTNEALAAMRIMRTQLSHLFSSIEMSRPFPSVSVEAALYDFQARISRVCRYICLVLDKRGA